jgi:YHS domain-containing protein
MFQKLCLFAIGLLFIGLVAIRVWRANNLAREMPLPVAAAQQRELYLAPGGTYTLTDIDANGRLSASQKYRGFQARHDSDPKSGDRLCPVTRTKASAECTWIVAGQEYQFCCPPCIDEFVRLAKDQPEQVQPPDAYVKH